MIFFRRSAWTRALALFLAFLGFYLLTASGHLYAVDEETLFRITEGIVERHSVALPNDAWGMVGNRSGPDGPLYAQYTPGQPLAAVPLYLAGKVLATRFPPDASIYILRFCVSLLGAFVTAATVALPAGYRAAFPGQLRVIEGERKAHEYLARLQASQVDPDELALIELSFLKGRARVPVPCETLMTYDS